MNIIKSYRKGTDKLTSEIFAARLSSRMSFEELFNKTYKYSNNSRVYLSNGDLFDRKKIRDIVYNGKLEELITCGVPNTVGVGYRKELGFYAYMTNEKGYANKDVFFYSSFWQALKAARKIY